MQAVLEVNDLTVHIDQKQVLNGVNLLLRPGELHALMGPNGSGKSSLACTLMGHPNYVVTQGTIKLFGSDITQLSPDKRARSGMFLAFQYPLEIPGARFADMLRQSYNALYAGTEKQCGLKAFRNLLAEKMQLLSMDHSFVDRDVNVGFSGGEKKRAEALQLAVLQPKLALLDEIDSGLDIDAIRVVCKGINTIKKEQPSMTILVITHYQRILNYLCPDYVHVMDGGSIVKSGGQSLAKELEKQGYCASLLQAGSNTV